MTFFTQEGPTEQKSFFQKVTVTKNTPEECLTEAIPLLRKIGRDIDNFLYQIENDWYYCGRKLTWEIK
jgi:hypothetical protein